MRGCVKDKPGRLATDVLREPAQADPERLAARSLARQKTFALCALARQLARTTNGFRLLAGLLLGRLFIMAAKFHLAKDAFALHFLLQRLERLIDIVVAYDDLNDGYISRTSR